MPATALVFDLPLHLRPLRFAELLLNPLGDFGLRLFVDEWVAESPVDPLKDFGRRESVQGVSVGAVVQIAEDQFAPPLFLISRQTH
jgi:hypothetical protein